MMKSMTELAGGELCPSQRSATKWERLEEEDLSPVYTWPTSSEPGQAPSQALCLVPLRACLHLSGPGTAPTRSSTWPPSICAMQCLCSSLFLDFDDVTELRWPVCCDHENDNFHLLHFALFANSRRHSADQLSPRCVVIIAFYWEKNKLKNCDGLSEILASN